MQWGANSSGGPAIDIFVSYSRADERWAIWIADTLESAGYRTMLQVWDFVPGTNFIEFIDRGISESRLVLAVLSPSYLQSRYGRVEWQAAWQAASEPGAKLVTVRVEECELHGLLSTITFVDLVAIEDPAHAAELLLQRMQEALDGRAKPVAEPGGSAFPAAPGLPSGAGTSALPPSQRIRPARGGAAPGARGEPAPDAGGAARRRAPGPAPYPVAARTTQPRGSVTVLHVAGTEFGAGLREDTGSRQGSDRHAQVLADVTQLVHSGAPRPDLVVVTGDLTGSGGRKEFEAALAFLTQLRLSLGLDRDRLVVVPGRKDVSRAACRAYFNECEADDLTPVPPYWPKWRHFSRVFHELYAGIDDVVFDSGQPWTLFPVPDLQVVVAGINTTMAVTHRPGDDHGSIGAPQASWFAEHLHQHEQQGWLRIGVMSDVPGPWPGALRDGASFTRLIAPRLNLLVHGPAPGPDGPHQLGAELTGVSVPEPGRIELISVTAEGLTRWSAPEGDEVPEPVRLLRGWHAAGATFDPGPELLPVPDDDGTDDEVRTAIDPLAQFLGQIEEVCRARYEGVRIRRVATDPPYLIVTRPQDGFARQSGVGALLGEPTDADVEAFLGVARGADPDLGLELVFSGPPPLPEIRERALRARVRLRSFTEFQGLLDLRAYVEGQTARLAGDRQYPPELYVPQRFRELDRPNQPVHDNLVGTLLRELGDDDGRFVLLLGDFGRGKTFAVREVAQRIPMELPHLIPILIELRALDKAHSIEGLVASHLADHGEQNIDLRAFDYMLRRGRIVLLFDGFDELVTRTTYERAADHLDTLLRAATGDAKIVLSSRTQHFQSRSQVLTALGDRVGLLSQRRLLSIEEFTPAQIRDYLVNHYHGDQEAADARLRLISGVQNLIDLAHNPRMLSFIADLAEERLLAVARVGRALSAAGLYREILSSWLAGEERRTRNVPGAPAGLGLDDLWRAVTRLALRLWEANESVLRITDITEVADLVAGMAEGAMSTAEATHALGTGTLLVRTDDGLFGFIHGSVVEWLVANEIATRLGRHESSLLSQRPLSQLTIDFVCDLADVRACEEWVERTLPDPDADDVARANAARLSTRLRIPAHTDLRGASLPGEDLSYRDLAGVDLTGADLTDARLVGANLSGARLRNARLVGARLDEAVLTGADLTATDLRRARMIRTDLREVTVTGSRWSRVSLIAATLDPGLTGAPELRGAALAPGATVQAELAPAGIGVPYGFHIRFGRLPQPLAYTGDDSTLAVGCDNGSVLICDTVSGLPIRTLHGHRARVYLVLAIGRNGLVTAGGDGELRMWDSATGAQRWSRGDHADWVWPVVAGHEGHLLATSDSSGAVQVLNAADGTVRHVLGGMTPPVWTAAFTPDDRLLACGASDGTVRLWQTGDGRLAQVLIGHGGSVFRVQFDATGEFLATADELGVIRIWETATGTLLRQLTGHTRSVYTMDFHPGGELLATADTGGTVRLWRLSTGQTAGVVQAHTSSVYQVQFSPDGLNLASLDSSGSVRMWAVQPAADPPVTPQHELRGHRAAVWPGAFRGDGTQFATAGNDGTLRLWDVADGQCRHVLHGHGRRITSISFSADGSRLAACGNDGVVRLWNPSTGQLTGSRSGSGDTLVSCVFSPAGDLLAAASNDGGVHLIGTGDGDEVQARELDAETDNIWAEAFSPDGRILATANDDDTVGLWFHRTGAQGHTLTGHRGRVRSIGFAPDGQTLVTGCDDQRLRRWGVESGRLLDTLEGHEDRVYAVAHNADGSLLASASWDSTVRIWDTRSDVCLHRLSGHVGRLWSAAFHPGADLVAAAGDDATISLWDARSGTHRGWLRGHVGRVYTVGFNHDGSLLASGGDDGTVRLWDPSAPPESALRMTLLGTPDGWATLAPDGRYKMEGGMVQDFWYSVGMCRFEPGELDDYLTQLVRRLPVEAPF
ncbi:TIR domain-containing protein [Kineosporia sp. J2-2]|uniref:TIR domain-containing protein n=1 Tax=Kineosporia corallincola TaxID=2835133 RepID=A0ABS5TH07_9ACTN|nr:TIR domain-containing protein [Kineosporia corallincola]MBT0770153.1 TIR domain-containing protein [Kineosporia corallincola]